MSDPASRIRNRRVFYISGFDPFGARRYLQLYREQGRLQAGYSGYELGVERVGWSEGKLVYQWRATCDAEGASSEALIDFLRWDDIVRQRMRLPIWRVYLMMMRLLWRYFGSGAGQAMSRLRVGPMIAGLYPVVVLFAYLLGALLAGWLATALAARLTGLPLWSMAPAGAAVFWFAMVATRRLDSKMFAYYIMCCLGMTAAHAEEEESEIDRRLDLFANRIKDACASGEADEVLVVGHSVGAQLAVQVMARAIRAGAGEGGAALSLLTIGEVAPMTTFLPRARRAREDMGFMAETEAADWVDVTAVSDGACFALSDPPAVAGVAPPPERRRNPKILSAAFKQTMGTETYTRLRRRYHRMHFQYISAFEQPAEYDYFLITAGPKTLSERFRNRRPSPNVIDKAVAPPLRPS